MKLVKVEELQPGMKVGQDVLLKNVIMVVPAGIELTEDTIKRLKRVGITQVYIDDQTEQSSSEEERQEKIRKMEQEVDAMFSKVIHNPLMQKLCDATKNILRNKIK